MAMCVVWRDLQSAEGECERNVSDDNAQMTVPVQSRVASGTIHIRIVPTHRYRVSATMLHWERSYGAAVSAGQQLP